MVIGVVIELTGEEQATLNTSRAEELARIDANAWKVARMAGYGSIGDQLDMQYKDLLDDTTTWKDHIAKVKSDNPKSE